MEDYQSIRWGQVSYENYLYGSEIIWKSPDHVSFTNSLMPSGEQIHAWSSQSIFQGTKTSAQLPLLKVGQAYQLVLLGQSQPADRFFFKLTFYDYYGDVLAVNYLRRPDDSFIVPNAYHYYEIALHHGGCLSLDFYQVLLKRADDSSEDPIEDAYSLYQADLSSPFLVFDEVGNGPQFSSLKGGKAEWSYLASLLSNGHLYLQGEAAHLLDQVAEQQSDLKLVGYGPISNLAALYHGYRLSCPTYVTEDFLPASSYLDLYAAFNLSSDLKGFLANYQDLLSSQVVTIYAPGLLEQSEPAAAFLLDYRPQLKLLKRGGSVDVRL